MTEMDLVIRGRDGASDDVNKVSRSLDKMDRCSKSAKSGMAGMWKEMFLGQAAFAVVSKGARAVINFFQESVELASMAAETHSKFGVVFQDVTEKAALATKDLNDNYGLAAHSAEKLLSDTGDILSGFGFTGEAAIELSHEVNTLAVDLASFTNIEGGAENASKALTAAMVGETERAKALGIVIRQDSKEFITLVENYKRAEGMTLLQAKAMAALNIAVKQSKNAIGDYARTQDSWANKMRELTERLDEIKVAAGEAIIDAALPALQDLVTYIKDNKEEIVSFVTDLTNLTISIAKVLGYAAGATKNYLANLHEAWKDPFEAITNDLKRLGIIKEQHIEADRMSVQEGKKVAEYWEHLRERAQARTDAEQELVQVKKDGIKVEKEKVAYSAEEIKVIQSLTKQIDKLKGETQDYSNLSSAVQKEISQLNKVIGTLTAQKKAATEATKKQAEEEKKNAEIYKKITEDFKERADIQRLLIDLNPIQVMSLEELREAEEKYIHSAQTKNDVDNTSKEIQEELIDREAIRAEQLQKTFQDLNSIASGIAAIGNAIGQFDSDLGSVVGAVGNFLGGIGDAVGKAASGDIVGAISSGIQTALTWMLELGGLFETWSYERIVKEQNEWMDLNDELRDQLVELSKEVGDVHLATSIMLDELIEGSEVTAENFDQWAERIGEIFQDIDEGLLSEVEGAKEIGDAWSALLEQAEELGLEGSASMLELIRQVREQGLEVAEITEYVFDQLQAGYESLGNYYSSMITDQESFNHAGAYTLAFIQALSEEGYSFVEIAVMMKDELLELFEMAQARGYQVSGVLQEMLNLTDFIDQNQELVDGVTATQRILESLGNTGYLSFENFGFIMQDVVSQFDQLVNAGATHKEALMLLAPTLSDLWWYAEQYNYELDQATQNLIEQAQAQGLINEGSIPAQERSVMLLEEIVILLGGEIPYALDDIVDQGQEIIDGVRDWKDALNEVNYPNVPKDNIKGYAQGGSFWATRPQLIMVGEGGEDEFVSVTPKSKYHGEGSGRSGIRDVSLTIGNISLLGGQSAEDVIFELKDAITGNKFQISDTIVDKVLEHTGN